MGPRSEDSEKYSHPFTQEDFTNFIIFTHALPLVPNLVYIVPDTISQIPSTTRVLLTDHFSPISVLSNAFTTKYDMCRGSYINCLA